MSYSTQVAKDRAAEVGSLPHVKAWLKRFKKVAADMPPEIWVYVAAGTPTIMACDENNRPIFSDKQDGADQGAVVDHASGGHWDGGDW